MNDTFENELRRALRPVDAPTGFTERLMRSLPARAAPVMPAPVIEIPVRASRRYLIPAALAASLLAAVLAGQHAAQLREERIARAEGLAARTELLQALRVTSEKLDLAYRAVQTTPDEGVTDEENRS